MSPPTYFNGISESTEHSIPILKPSRSTNFAATFKTPNYFIRKSSSSTSLQNFPNISINKYDNSLLEAERHLLDCSPENSKNNSPAKVVNKRESIVELRKNFTETSIKISRKLNNFEEREEETSFINRNKETLQKE